MSRWYFNLTEEQREKIREKRRYKYASQSVGYNEHQEVPNDPNSGRRKYVISEDIREVYREQSRNHLRNLNEEQKERLRERSRRHYSEYYPNRTEEQKEKVRQKNRENYWKHRDKYKELMKKKSKKH